MTVYMFEYLVPVILLLAIIISAVRILREYERGVVFFLGRFQKVKGPGLIIVIPVQAGIQNQRSLIRKNSYLYLFLFDPFNLFFFLPSAVSQYPKTWSVPY